MATPNLAICKRMARQAVGAYASMPVEIVAGNAAPKLIGDRYHWRTPSGKRVSKAYTRKCYSCTYVRGTERVQVGADWVVVQ